MTAQKSLTGELRTELKVLEDDLRRRVSSQPTVDEAWRGQHREALECGRTAASWQEWSDDRITQAAVAWILTTVFIRFAEDNVLVKPVWISGPKARRQEALNAQSEFLRTQARTNPDVTDREWLQHAIEYFAGLPATKALVDETSALWLVTPSGDAAARLLAFWRERGEAGDVRRDLTDKTLDTRFLGDLYQDLSEEAKSRYALLQTPVFVEEFILDRTLKPALDERPLDGFRMIDPTCGSGHFLLGAFERLRERWEEHAPGLDRRARVQKALDAIHGVDLNPFAVAIARFRLTIAAMQASGDEMLENAPNFEYHLAVGDSLLHGLDQGELDFGAEHSADRTAANYTYPTENIAALRKILENGRYDVVVGNPPYKSVSDKALKQAYRDRYHYLKGQYQLTVPFMERFFNLAKAGERPGWVGKITGNGFMRREFGAPLIEKFLTIKDLSLVADTSGAYIPDHGTPTVILVGRNRRPVGETVRAALGLRGEPGRPAVPAKGLVWTALTQHVDEPGYSDEWVTITNLSRNLLATHPWSLSGGGAVELKRAIDAIGKGTIGRSSSRIGFFGDSHADEAFFLPPHYARRLNMPRDIAIPSSRGDDVRDWIARTEEVALLPYDAGHRIRPLSDLGTTAARQLWPLRTFLWARTVFGGASYRETGRSWLAWHQLPRDENTSSLSITLGEVATHNHFVLNRARRVFNRTAPVIKFAKETIENDVLAMLGVMNSSSACFWLKQACFDKGNGGIGGGIGDEAWERRYAFNGANIADLPQPDSLPLERGHLLDRLAQQMGMQTPTVTVATGTPSQELLDGARRAHAAVRAEMIAQQEELDWDVYRRYGLVEDDLTYSGDDLPQLALGERAFEIVLARQVAEGTEQTAWFERHGSTPITEIPARWPAAYRELVQRRIELIESHPYLRLLERPEYKRRWAAEPWEKQEERALRGWLLDRLEDQRFWFDRAGAPTPRSVAQLADDVARDPDLVSVLSLWEGRPDVPVMASLQKLLAEEAVPFLAAYRYKESGLRKREAWEHTWALQRREDAGEKFGTGTPNGPIPVPEKYTSTDFARKEYWAHRGKLDVPKERFILYPDAGRDTDPTPVLGWAGWDHAQQSFAIEQLLQWREGEGWPDERLVPLVAGLAELLPWVEQWHSEPDAFYGGVSPADFFRTQLDERSRRVERTPDQLAAWRPAPARRGRTRTAARPMIALET